MKDSKHISIGKVDSRFNNSTPQDAHELLMCMLEQLKERRSGSSGGGIEMESVGQFRSTMACTQCLNASSSQLEEFNCLSVQIGDLINPLVTDCIEEYMKDEVIPLETGWWCETCCAISTGEKRLVVERSPKILIVSLKRFLYQNGDVGKVGTQVGICEKIMFGYAEYRLVGIVKHSGSRESGHYVAVTCWPDGWAIHNDAKVDPSCVKELHWCPDSYILFYQEAECSQYPTPPFGGAPPRSVVEE